MPRTFEQDWVTSRHGRPAHEDIASLRIRGERGFGEKRKYPFVFAQDLDRGGLAGEHGVFSETFPMPTYRTVALGSSCPMAVPDPWWVRHVDIMPTGAGDNRRVLVEVQLTLDGWEDETLLVAANTLFGHDLDHPDDQEAWDDHTVVMQARASHWASSGVTWLWSGALPDDKTLPRPHPDEKRLLGINTQHIGVVPGGRTVIESTRTGHFALTAGYRAETLRTTVTVR